MAEGDELLVLAEDQRIRDEEIRLRSTHPEHRDFTPLRELLVEDEAAYLPEGFNETWGSSVELNGRIDVLRQQTFRRSDEEIIVRSCERDWLHRLELSPTEEPSTFRGNVGTCVQQSDCFAVTRLVDGDMPGSLQELLCPETRDVESVCDGFATDYSTVGRP